MRIAILSDIHSNLEALQAVSAEIERSSPDVVLFAGDVVGYGPDPNECTRWVMDRADLAVAGNHDHAAVGLLDHGTFNPNARDAVVWNAERLEGWAAGYLRSLPVTLGEGSVRLAHASPRKPEEWDYILTLWDAEVNFAYFAEDVCFVGHSHQPVTVGRDPEGAVQIIPGDSFTGRPGWRYLVNVGSVGQPRDGNPDACFGILDTDPMEYRLVRVPYDVGATQAKMRSAGLPGRLADRLASGR